MPAVVDAACSVNNQTCFCDRLVRSPVALASNFGHRSWSMEYCLIVVCIQFNCLSYSLQLSGAQLYCDTQNLPRGDLPLSKSICFGIHQASPTWGGESCWSLHILCEKLLLFVKVEEVAEQEIAFGTGVDGVALLDQDINVARGAPAPTDMGTNSLRG